MPIKKSLQSKKTPPSQMLRVPTPLIEAVQKLSRLHRLGHKNAVLHGLQSLISTIDSSDIDFGESDEAIKQLTLRLEKLESRQGSDSDIDSSSILKSVTSLEQKLEAQETRIAQMEGAISILGQRQQTSPRRQAFNYHPPQVKLQPYNGENLAKRLGIDVATLERSRSTLSPKDFDQWCRSKDPSSMAWRLESDGLYHPVK